MENCLKTHSEYRERKCEPCNAYKPLLYCKQVIDTSKFRSYQTRNSTLSLTNSTVKANSLFT